MHERRGPTNLVLALSPALCSVGVGAGQRPRQRVSGAEAPALTPRTPDCASPRPLVLSNAGNRKSSDSWNSLESADYEPDTEWKTDHLNFLIRTVEGLRASNLTPYNGVPPANLLDKVSLNIVNAKESWPHTARQTRLKLLELCRCSWREKLQGERRSSVIREETGSDVENDPNGGTPARRRPLHRQSSMDFMHSAKLGNKAGEGLGKLSRLQQGPTTPKTERRSSNLNPRTPSSTTLNSSVSASSGPRLTKRSSTLTISSTDSYNGPCLLDPRVQRIRRSDSFGSLRVLEPQSAQGTPATPAIRRTLKRAPSYGSSRSAGSTKFDMDTEEDCLEPVRSSNHRDKSKHRPRKDSTSSQTSDEEEKHRGKKSKKARRRSPSPPPPPSSLPCSPDMPIPFPSPAPMPIASSSRRRPRICPKRNPSMFGPELTGLGGLGALGPRSPISACPTSFPAQLSAAAVVNAAAEAEAREAEEVERRRPRTMLASPATPDMTSPRRLRRVKAKDLLAARPSALGPAALARRISFGTLQQPESSGAVESVPSALGGAFELI